VVDREPQRSGSLKGFDPNQPQFRLPRRVINGRSYLYAEGYGIGYQRPVWRPQLVDMDLSHIGVRCVRRTARGG
jgi:formylglycine-generating enzyme